MTLLLIAVILVTILSSVQGVKVNRYPDYSKLNYKLADVYSGPTFLDRFDYFTEEDPTDGFVHYVDRDAATRMNLTYAGSSSVVLRVDTTDAMATTGRRSVRLESKTSYDDGLFLFDIIHAPYGCGTWPALWLTDGYNWPANGEIDVLETNNRATQGNEVTLHTTEGCEMRVKRKQTGTKQEIMCGNATYSNHGCGVEGRPETAGQGLNDVGGGVSPFDCLRALTN